MADFFFAISEDGVRFKLNSDGSWEPDTRPENKDRIRFRSSNWGDSVAQVKAVEELEPILETDEGLFYKTKVGDFPVYLTFIFHDDMLSSGVYMFSQKHANKNDFITDFEAIKKLIVIKYGEPSEAIEQWLNDLYKDDPAKRGLAVTSGHLSIVSKWTDEETNINLGLIGAKKKCMLVATYSSKRLEHLVDAAREREKLAGL